MRVAESWPQPSICVKLNIREYCVNKFVKRDKNKKNGSYWLLGVLMKKDWLMKAFSTLVRVGMADSQYLSFRVHCKKLQAVAYGFAENAPLYGKNRCDTARM